MAVTLTIKFTGLCLFVPQPDEDVVSVYLPNATRPWRALDFYEIHRHEARIIHRIRDSDGNTTKLCRYLLTLDTMPDGRLSLPDTPTPDADKDSVDRSDMLSLSDIVPRYPIRRETPGNSLLRGRIDLKSGELAGTQVAQGWKWDIEPTMPGRTYPKEQAYPWMISWKMELGQLPNVPLTPDGHNSANCAQTNLKDLDPPEIEIWHVPSGYLPPNTPPTRTVHDHFRWFYEFVEAKDHLRQSLPPEGLPVPRMPGSLTKAELRELRDKSPETHDCLPGCC